MKLRAIVVSHHKRFRRDLAKLVELVDSCIEVIGEEATPRDAAERIHLLNPELVFVDLGLRGDAGLKLTEQIHWRWPQIAVVVVGNEPSNDYRGLALAAGALEYVDLLEISTQLPEALAQIDRSRYCVEQEGGIVESATSTVPPTGSPVKLRSRLRTAPTGPKHGPFTAWQYVHLALATSLSLLVMNMWFASDHAAGHGLLILMTLLAVTIVEARQFSRARKAAETPWRGDYPKGGLIS